MAAIRQVLDEHVIRLDPKRQRDFTADVPIRFIEHEHDIAKILELWDKSFRPSMNKLWHTRRSALANRYQRKAVFKSATENLCNDFSRRTENIKVLFDVIRDGEAYRLKLVKLSTVPDSIRNARSILAEIPDLGLDHEVDAELVRQEGLQQQASSAGNDPAMEAEVLYSYREGNNESPSSATFAATDTYVASSQQQPYNDNDNIPLAQEVSISAASPVAAEATRAPSALERMQELESIKHFLTDLEYSSKRQAILDSI